MKNKIRILSEKILKLRDEVKTEESTKTSMILPLFQILEYDIFNPKELTAEFIADIGIKKGEKVDYLISKNNIPTFLVECKKWNEPIVEHRGQLLRYYHTSKAKFGILTNGIIYEFFTDSENPNIMDDKPFFTFNFEKFDENDLDMFIKFSKSLYNENLILEEVERIKYLSKFKNIILSELSNPTKEFSDLIIRQVYSGRLTKKQFDIYFSIFNQALKELFNNQENNVKAEKESGIVTTEEELEVFNFILDSFPEYSNVLSYKDFKGHFSIIVNNNTRKCVLKALFNQKKKYIILWEGDNEIKLEYTGNNCINLDTIKNKIIEYLK